MGPDWSVCRLDETYDFSSGLSKPRSAFGTGFPFLAFKDVFDNYFVPEKLSELVESSERERERCSVREGDVFLTRTSETDNELGMSSVALRSIPDATFNGFTKRLRPKLGVSVEPRYAGYYFRGPSFRRAVSSMASSSTRASLNNEMLSRLTIVLPPVHEQRRIASVLGVLDDKIQLIRRIRRTLDETAQAVFKSWFVDFDPVNAKAEGRKRGLAEDLAAVFPCGLASSLIGPVPLGWRVEQIGQHVEVERGLSYTGKGLADAGEGVPMHNLNSVLEGGGYKYDGIKWYSGDYRRRHLVRPGDLIVANTEQGFDHLLIGYPALVPAAFGEAGLFSHHLYRVRPEQTSPLSTPYLYCMLRDPHFHAVLAGYTNGTTVNMLPSDAFEHPRIVVPPVELVGIFSDTVRPLLERIEALHGEVQTLAGLRDTLLPRLLSGELRVADAESALEEAV
ncbi:MAG TPA: restriction endonuclease subunit S [Coriobacteriia bacterium]|jgi:type I restriction enzyme S subunit